jgi:hypothetical protein
LAGRARRRAPVGPRCAPMAALQHHREGADSGGCGVRWASARGGRAPPGPVAPPAEAAAQRGTTTGSDGPCPVRKTAATPPQWPAALAAPAAFRGGGHPCVQSLPGPPPASGRAGWYLRTPGGHAAASTPVQLWPASLASPAPSDRCADGEQRCQQHRFRGERAKRLEPCDDASRGGYELPVTLRGPRRRRGGPHTRPAPAGHHPAVVAARRPFGRPLPQGAPPAHSPERGHDRPGHIGGARFLEEDAPAGQLTASRRQRRHVGEERGSSWDAWGLSWRSARGMTQVRRAGRSAYPAW